MKVARILVLGVALAAGGAAAFLVGSDDEKKPEAPAPVAQFSTVDVLIAKSDIGMGTSVSAQDLQWQAWPAATNRGGLHHQKGPAERHRGAVWCDHARAVTAGEPIRDGQADKVNGAAGYMRRCCRPACAPFRPRFRLRPVPAASSCRTTASTSSCRSARPRRQARQQESCQRDDPGQREGAGDRSDGRGEERPARRWVGKTATLELAPRPSSRNADAIAAAWDAVARAPQPARRQQDHRDRRRRPEVRHQHRPLWRQHEQVMPQRSFSMTKAMLVRSATLTA